MTNQQNNIICCVMQLDRWREGIELPNDWSNFASSTFIAYSSHFSCFESSEYGEKLKYDNIFLKTYVNV